jgi:DNA-binding transcriptional LysR family regulator
MELRHLRYFIAVAEELNFGRAAIRLRISQPPLSQQIRQLEEELGVKLFERNKRQVRLTEEGKRIVVEAQQILGQVDHFLSVTSKVSAGTIGRLSVAGQAVLNDELVRTLRIFARQYPGVHIQLHFMNTAQQIESLRDEQVDIGFLHLPVEYSDLTLEPIKREPLWLALPREHMLAKQKNVKLVSLVEQPFIMFARRSNPGLHDVIVAACRNAGFSLNVVHEVDNSIAAMTLVSAGLGLAFCSPSWRQLWPDVEFRPFRDTVPALEYAVAYRRGAQSPALDSFLKVVRQIVRQNRRATTKNISRGKEDS